MFQSHRGRVAGIVLIMVTLAAVLLVVLSPSGPSSSPSGGVVPKAPEPRRLTVEILDTLPHDPEAYTQGLVWNDGLLYESTGQYGRSDLRRVDPETGEILSSRALSSDEFGEGLARVDDRLIQLTWQEGKALVWDLQELEQLDRFTYEGEGWGLCFDGHHLVMSDGTSRLAFRDPVTFEIERVMEVLLGDGAVGRLNELECAEGWIYANVYTTDWIVEIDPRSGRVHGLIDASGLLPAAEARRAEVLNGIAYDAEREIFYLTGKLWPKLFAVRFVESQGQ